MQETGQFTESQQEEIVALQSIYPDYVAIDNNEPVLILDVPVEFLKVTRVIISSQDHGRTQETTSVSYLPPITVTITLPPEYPNQKSASISRITAKTAWLPLLQLEQLKAHLFSLWQPESQMLYEWLECIHSGQFLTDMGLLSSNNVLRLEHASPRTLLPQLELHAQQVNRQQFAQATYYCSICFTSRKGSSCVKLSGCNHVFCRACLSGFWASAITDGNLSRVGCADIECIRAKREASVDDVRAVFNLSPHLNISSTVTPDKTVEGQVQREEVWFQKWIRLSERWDLARDKHAVYCPICQEGVRRPPEAEGETSGWRRYRICQACKFSFCNICRKTWHGPQIACQLTEEQLVRYIRDSQENFGEPTSWIKGLEMEYGVDNVKEQVDAFSPEYMRREQASKPTVSRKNPVVARYRDFLTNTESDHHQRPAVWDKNNHASEVWILKNTVPCPDCGVPTVKENGCPLVICNICDAEFYWRLKDDSEVL